MDDLISRQSAIDAVYKCTDYYVGNLPVMIDKADAYKALADLPTVDAVPVVRCKDCRFSTWYDAADGVKRCFCDRHGSAGHTEKDFCSYAEREEMD